jgi:hypothetical protein
MYSIEVEGLIGARNQGNLNSEVEKEGKSSFIQVILNT